MLPVCQSCSRTTNDRAMLRRRPPAETLDGCCCCCCCCCLDAMTSSPEPAPRPLVASVTVRSFQRSRANLKVRGRTELFHHPVPWNRLRFFVAFPAPKHPPWKRRWSVVVCRPKSGAGDVLEWSRIAVVSSQPVPRRLPYLGSAVERLTLHIARRRLRAHPTHRRTSTRREPGRRLDRAERANERRRRNLVPS